MRRAGGAVQGRSLACRPCKGTGGEWAGMPVAACARYLAHRQPYTIIMRSTLWLVSFPRCTRTHSLAASVVAYDVSPVHARYGKMPVRQSAAPKHYSEPKRGPLRDFSLTCTTAVVPMVPRSRVLHSDCCPLMLSWTPVQQRAHARLLAPLLCAAGTSTLAALQGKRVVLVVRMGTWHGTA